MIAINKSIVVPNTILFDWLFLITVSLFVSLLIISLISCSLFISLLTEFSVNALLLENTFSVV